MKLSGRGSPTSFFEIFSDLIFATMTIFVLLMIVFLIQVHLPSGLEELEAQIAERRTEIANIDPQLQRLETEVEKLERSTKGYESYNFEIVVVIDSTGSMTAELDLLAQTISIVGRVMPKISTETKIGVIAYRKDQQNVDRTKVFPLTTIMDEDVDSGRSLGRLRSFTSSLRAEEGTAPLESAFDQAIKMYSDAEEFEGHQTLVLIGDVGPYEDFFRDQTIDAKNLQQERGMIDQLRIWTEQSYNRNLVILFSGDDEIDKTAEFGGEQYQKFLKSRDFFQSLADGVGKPEAFSRTPSDMLPLILNGILD